jgi:signal peptide peptidase SppA
MVAPESGMMSYDGIRGMFRAAMADPAVSQIILDVNSHGGEVHGVFDLAAEIFAGRHQKQSMAVINETGASAAYLLASACNIVVMPENGMAGSVGIVMRHVDMSKLNEKEGVAVSYIYAGATKVQGHPDAALSDGDRADLQSRVDEVYAQFVTTVAKYRGMRPEAVRATEAAVFRGQAAEAVGLTDDTLPAGEAYDMGPVALGAALAKYKFPPGG